MADASFSAPVPPPGQTACPRCGALMPEQASFCPACGSSMKPISSRDRIVAALGYFPLLPAAVVLFLPAFRKSPFVRFHAWQSLALWAVFLVGSMVALFLSNFAGAIIFLVAGILFSLAMFFLWIVLSVKAWQGVRLALPVFGPLAARLR